MDHRFSDETRQSAVKAQSELRKFQLREEHIQEYKKEKYQKDKPYRQEQVLCDVCGQTLQRGSLHNHMKRHDGASWQPQSGGHGASANNFGASSSSGGHKDFSGCGGRGSHDYLNVASAGSDC